MKIKIIAPGKIKEKYLSDAVAEYAKRIGRFAAFEICEVSDMKIPENASLAQEKEVMEKEAEKILQRINPSAFVIALCVEGKMIDSEELSDVISKQMLSGKSEIDFIIGGSLGLDDTVKRRADMQLSFSKMTFPHMLMRVILSEQIYRSFKIMNNEKYHK